MAEKVATDGVAADAIKGLQPLAKVLQRTAEQLWKIFVMRYVAKGLSQVFLAVTLSGFSYLLLHRNHLIWITPFVVASLVLAYDAIQLLVNPYYYALNDVILRLRNEHLLK